MSDDLSDQRLARRIARLLPGLRFVQQEQASYTPTYLGAVPGVTTYTFQSGTWRRIGPVVHVTGQVSWSAATGTGNAQVSLPFTAMAVNFTSAVYLNGVTFANSTPTMLITGGNSFFTMGSPLTNAGPTTVQVEAVGNLIFSCTYFVA